MTRARILLIAGYFDWFSGYQETVLAAAFSRLADVEILASDRVGPIFTNQHLAKLGVARRYSAGMREEGRVIVTRVRTKQWRSIVWGQEATRLVEQGNYNLIIQIMPGQGLPMAASIARTRAKRVVIYGDNSAMWATLSRRQQKLKSLVFGQTKGRMYRFANQRADIVYGSTSETLTRLAPFSPSPLRLLPLTFDERRFTYSTDVRARARVERQYDESNRVIISAGKFNPTKRLDLLVKSFASCHEQDPNLRLLLVGSDGGTQTSELKSLIGSLGIAHVSRIEGFLDHQGLNAAFNAADIGVWPRQPAITIQQAMGTGLPVVLPKSPWVEHLILQDTGKYVSSKCTPEELGAGVTAALHIVPCERDARARANAQRFGGTAVAESILSDVDLL